MKKIFEFLIKNKKTIAFMESCTGGYLANELTNIEGASEILKVSLVTYSNEYKIKFGVSKNIIDKFSVYSIETAKEMSKAISQIADSDYGVGITGMLGKTDLHNKSLEINKVYFAIYEKKSKKNIAGFINIYKTTRKSAKKGIAKIIEEKFCKEFGE